MLGCSADRVRTEHANPEDGWGGRRGVNEPSLSHLELEVLWFNRAQQKHTSISGSADTSGQTICSGQRTRTQQANRGERWDCREGGRPSSQELGDDK
jgi:hypothetical protein